ncbi:phosphate acyltransferase, partial [Sinorhizobium meliloti]
MKPLDRIIDAARKAPRHVVLPEGEDPRIVAGAVQARREGLAAITLVGNREVITQRL